MPRPLGAISFYNLQQQSSEVDISVLQFFDLNSGRLNILLHVAQLVNCFMGFTT